MSERGREKLRERFRFKNMTYDVDMLFYQMCSNIVYRSTLYITRNDVGFKLYFVIDAQYVVRKVTSKTCQ